MKRPSKYRAIKTEFDGHLFDSKAESQRYAELRILEKIGEIQNLELQPKFPIIIDGEPLRIPSKRGKGRPIVVKMDFSYLRDGYQITEDFKGCDNPMSRLKRALVEHIYHLTILVTH